MKFYKSNELVEIDKDKVKSLFQNNELTQNSKDEYNYCNLGYYYYKIEKDYEKSNRILSKSY